MLAAKHRNIAVRRGVKKANLAIAHKILVAAFFILRDQTPFISSQNNKMILQKRRIKKIERLQRELENLKNMSD